MKTCNNAAYPIAKARGLRGEISITGDKNSSIAVCKRLFPGVSLIPTPKCRKENSDLAEAILMCEYARRKLGVA